MLVNVLNTFCTTIMCLFVAVYIFLAYEIDPTNLNDSAINSEVSECMSGETIVMPLTDLSLIDRMQQMPPIFSKPFQMKLNLPFVGTNMQSNSSLNPHTNLFNITSSTHIEAVFDRYETEGQAVLLSDELNAEWVVSKHALPQQARVNTWFDVYITDSNRALIRINCKKTTLEIDNATKLIKQLRSE